MADSPCFPCSVLSNIRTNVFFKISVLAILCSCPALLAGIPAGDAAVQVSATIGGRKGVTWNMQARHFSLKHLEHFHAHRPAYSLGLRGGNLESHEGSRDIKIGSFSLEVYGKVLIQDTTIELNYGRRYGLLGANGVGKTSFLKALAARLVPIPEFHDIFILSEEAKSTNMSALEYVVAAAEHEVNRLEKKVEVIIEQHGPDADELQHIYDRIDSIGPATLKVRAGKLLAGLGFDAERMAKQTKDMSGGWRMRVALAEALFVRPSILLLDEPTNHLDLGSVVWLEDYLSRYDSILVVTSHSQDFLNGVCTNIMELRQMKLTYWTGNYDQFVKTKTEQEANQMKLYYKQQDEIKHMKEFIASCGTYANLVRQAKSRQKVLDKMEEDGLIQPVVTDKKIKIEFPQCDKLVPPVIAFTDVAFSYSGKPEDYLYENLNIGIDSDSRVALVGPNGAGKSTLLKLMCGRLHPSKGSITIKHGTRLGVFDQHMAEKLDLDLSPIEYMQKRFPGKFKDLQDWRTAVGRFGVTGKQQMEPIRKMSDGQKRRVVWAELWLMSPNMLLLDEPTNHLDMESIDALAEGIKQFQGGLLLISHDFRLIDQVAQEVWVCEKGVTKWTKGIREYKELLKEQMLEAQKGS
ncbi:hypothetical protein GUITHDRAFT_157245 [Guillardia theta CCMP2712]|uniref:ABC transporter domain-containing protein n=1 Tax=Guillardia theta (strain CCMP2712) TaxID=905079 RepID=L1JR34_GUITC|nr:hypothetical protein GUITHDRAFT_157245 [Guillardia theta CCMP2712]EKX50744.1 hypothetical protein GUITHDRAFT_157245 [Guillardia theta CCMP2712]|eukprot:XP_005837724.1 hypothetical protein GUITHDRAFT_157245 [Guillardia theta CCMP2712]